MTYRKPWTQPPTPGCALRADRRRSPASALIVGATGQLGTALAEGLGRLGCDLGVCGIDEAALNALARRIRSDHGVRVTAGWADVTQRQSLQAFFHSCSSERPIDWIIVNAGVGSARPPGQPMEGHETVDRLVAVNLLGGLNAIRSAIEIFEASSGGRIVIVSSLASLAGSPENPAYAATKAAIRIGCLSMRPALAKRNISMTLAHPGFLAERTKDGGANWRPFAISPTTAADKIIKAALRDKAETAFPWQMAWLVKTMATLPLGLRDRIYGRLSADPEAT